MFSCRTCVSLAIPADSDSYIQRDDDELATLKAQRRKGRPPSADEERLTQMIDSEQREFRGGFWLPDLRDQDGRLKLERWSGDWAGMNSLKFVRVVETGAIRPSSFPPKGQS
jgi:translation machinery-associated protein 16